MVVGRVQDRAGREVVREGGQEPRQEAAEEQWARGAGEDHQHGRPELQGRHKTFPAVSTKKKTESYTTESITRNIIKTTCFYRKGALGLLPLADSPRNRF